MTSEERERLAVLETKLTGIDTKVEDIVENVRSINAALNQIKGGKNAMWVLWSVVRGVIAIISTIFGGAWYHG